MRISDMKRKILLFLSFFLWVGVVEVAAQNDLGELVDGIRYTVGNYGTDSAYAQVMSVEGTPVKLKFPNTVKVYGKKVPVKVIASLGSGGTNLQEVTLPKTLVELKGFRGCRQLTDIEIPESVVKIGLWAFKDCVSLRSIVLPEGLREIGMYAFQGCTGLMQVTFPSTLEKLGSSAFQGCTSLRSVTIPHSVKDVGAGAFQGCKNLTQVQLGNSMKQIPNGMFDDCSKLSQITIPQSVEAIGDDAFFNCTSLKRVQFAPQSGVKVIGERAFCNCTSLTGFTPDDSFGLAGSLKRLGDSAFSRCKSLNFSLTTAANLDSIPKHAFYQCESLKEVSLNDALYIGEYAFWECKSLKSVFLTKEKIKYIGIFAFGGCKSLEYVHNLHSDIEFGAALYSVFPNNVDVGDLQLSYSYNSKDMLTKAIAEWQKKKKYETTAQWRKRVTAETRMQKYEELKDSVRASYIAKFSPDSLQCRIESYDADAGVFKLKVENLNLYRHLAIGGMSVAERTVGDPRYLYAKVPAAEAENFEKQWAKVKLQPTYCITKDYLDVASCTFILGNKKYESPVLYDDESADLNIELPPLDLDLLDSATPDMAAVKDKTIDENIPATGANSPKTFVVIVGNENYKQVARVPYALNDAKVFKEYCQKTLGVPADNIRSYPDATYAMMLTALKDIQDISAAYKGDISVIFYYAGHGVPSEKDRTTYLLPVDADGAQPEVCMPVSRLYEGLANMKARSVTVFMDACFSGSQRGEGMLASARGVAIKAKEAAPQGNMVIFTAASGDETAYPYREKGHGMFTYFLLKKLRDTKGETTLGELGNYIIDNVRQQSLVVNRRGQTPTVSAAESLGETWKDLKLK